MVAYTSDSGIWDKDEVERAHFNDQRMRESYLIGMMRTNYLKRLESSVHSFEVSIERIIEKIDDLLQKIYHFEDNLDEYTAPDLFKDQGEEWKKDLKKDRKQLRHTLKDERSSRVNPLGRSLLYIRNDGTVRFTFTQSKKILTMFQKLCVGKDSPYQELCDLFDKETDNGARMDKYSELLTKAVRSIASTFRKRTAAGLQTGRDFVISDRQAQANDNSDFGLVTWLVIKES